MRRSFGMVAALLCALPACQAAVEDVSETSADLTRRETYATLDEGQLVIHAPEPAACAEPSCLDADGDSLSDAWEDAILERVRPRLVLDPEEPVLLDPTGAFGLVGRVYRPEGAPPNIVRVLIVVGFSYDDGVTVAGLSLTGHDGDSERVGLELELWNGGREAVVRRAFFSAHEGMPNNHSHLYEEDQIGTALTWGQDPDEQPRWLVFPSRAKHAEFADPVTCEEASLWGTTLFSESCGDTEGETTGVIVDPPLVNAGEREHPRVTDLAVVNFPGEVAWDGSSFCGGRRPLPSSERRLFCGGAIAKKLTNDPFE